MEGEQGLRDYSKGLNNTAMVLMYTPLAPAAEVMAVGSDLIDTGLEFKNDNPQAASNLWIRFIGTATGGVLGAKVVNQLPIRKYNKDIIEGAINQGGEILEDHYTEDKK